jgi:ABC-type antimicrobial peptide transport system permease subunit
VRRAVWSANASLSVANERTMREIYDRSMERASFTLVLLALAGMMTLALGVIGIYGAIAYAAAQQMREIGIRVALGAPPGSVTGMFVRRRVVLTGVGVIIGLIAAIALTRVMSSLLFGIGPLDPLTYAVVSLTLIVAAAAASYIPAHKASALDPVRALRAQ